MKVYDATHIPCTHSLPCVFICCGIVNSQFVVFHHPVKFKMMTSHASLPEAKVTGNSFEI